MFACIYLSLDLSSALPYCGVIFALTIGIRTDHLSYWCDPEGEDVHGCFMQKTIMLDGQWYGHWKAHMKLLVRGINKGAWIAVKMGGRSLPYLQQRGRSPSLRNQDKEWFER